MSGRGCHIDTETEEYKEEEEKTEYQPLSVESARAHSVCVYGHRSSLLNLSIFYNLAIIILSEPKPTLSITSRPRLSDVPRTVYLTTSPDIRDAVPRRKAIKESV